MAEKTQVESAPADAVSAEIAWPHGFRPSSRRWFPIAVLFTGLILTVAAAYYAARTIQLRSRAEFETAALRTRSTVRAQFEIYKALLRGTAGFIAVEKEVTRDRFKSYVARLRIGVNYPGVQGIGFAPRVAAPDEQKVVAAMAEQGGQNFRIWPETNGPDFYPVVYVEPESSNNAIGYGYNMFTEPVRREAMERARDTGDAAASGRLARVPEIESSKQPGFLIYFPVYQGGTLPSDSAERRARLQGFVFGVFQAGDLFSATFGDEDGGSRLEIYDGSNTDSANLLFESPTKIPGALPFRPEFQDVKTLDICGRTWTTRFSAEPQVQGTWIVLSLLLGGAGLSLVMFYLTHAEGRALRASERAAAQLRVSEIALRESEERLRRYATELEHRVAERTANLAQSLQSLEGVLYHVAHDLRAPLRSMSSFTHILLDEYGAHLDERGRDYARRISNAAQRMDGLVQDLLAYGRLAHTAVPVNTVNLDAEVKTAVSQFSEDIHAQRASVEVCSPLPAVKANAAVLNQILSNLISNALKFVKTGTPPHVRIRAEEATSRLDSSGTKPNGVPSLDVRLSALDGKIVRLWVEDDGIGIQPEYHERIFRMFERLHGVGVYPGTGIGLAIVHKAAERMGGRVGVESAPGKGSRFWVELPAA